MDVKKLEIRIVATVSSKLPIEEMIQEFEQNTRYKFTSTKNVSLQYTEYMETKDITPDELKPPRDLDEFPYARREDP